MPTHRPICDSEWSNRTRNQLQSSFKIISTAIRWLWVRHSSLEYKLAHPKRVVIKTFLFLSIFTAPLYLKATILEANKAETYWKSDRFVPTISARWDPKSATVKLTAFKANLDKVSIYISLGCKTKMAKKEILGKASIDAKSTNADTWRECLRQPGVPKTFWVNFEWYCIVSGCFFNLCA